jgi:hypothetical protein
MEHEIGGLIKMAVGYGVPFNTVMLILFLPIVVTVITFFRQIVGIKAFGIYTPAMITFAFLIIGMQSGNLLNGAKYGVAIFVMVIIVGTLSRVFMKRFRLLYLPRMAIVITMVAFVTLGVLMVSGSFQRTGLANVSIFPILIMITLVEKFVSTQIEKGSRIAIILSIETLAISLIAYFLIGWPTLASFVQKYPLAVFLTIAINIFLGRWSGLRITEYFRFNNLINGKNDSKK